ncbi:hypothetical protein WJX81_004773 [Elliptochloris bilobata]|uniref:EF-hand domain-containing protein n=1 Tax=Elliptochloris bilobata TaxID=381761 RepID=A0AAW1SIP2_9CHLO
MGMFRIKHLPASVNASVFDWLRSRGHAVRPELSRVEREQLQDCFTLIDADGSGAIDVSELWQAFRLLNLRVSKAQVTEMLAEVDADGSGEVEFPEFLEIMTMSREREAEEDAAGGRPHSAAAGAHGAWGGTPRGEPAGGAPQPGGGPAPLPLDLMMLGYKRKKLVDGVMAGDGTREQLIARGEAAALRKRQAEEHARQQAFKRRLAAAVTAQGPDPSPAAPASTGGHARRLPRRVMSLTGGQAAAAAQAAVTAAYDMVATRPATRLQRAQSLDDGAAAGAAVAAVTRQALLAVTTTRQMAADADAAAAAEAAAAAAKARSAAAAAAASAAAAVEPLSVKRRSLAPQEPLGFGSRPERRSMSPLAAAVADAPGLAPGRGITPPTAFDVPLEAGNPRPSEGSSVDNDAPANDPYFLFQAPSHEERQRRTRDIRQRVTARLAADVALLHEVGECRLAAAALHSRPQRRSTAGTPTAGAERARTRQSLASQPTAALPTEVMTEGLVGGSGPPFVA